MSNPLELIIVTGMSGAGKSKALDLIEDVDYYCVDNMPPELIPGFVKLCRKSAGRMQRVAIGADIRSLDSLNTLRAELHRLLTAKDVNCRILFMDAATPVLVRRFKETRRRHPLAGRVSGSTDDIIEYEREKLAPICELADFIIDSSSTTTGQLWSMLSAWLLGTENTPEITVVSFGYMHGLPADADFVFDVRCLPNPYYVDALRDRTGTDRRVAEYVFADPRADQYVLRIHDLISTVVPMFAGEGRGSLIVALGCTGGRHRSVALSERLVSYLRDDGLKAQLRHRDAAR